MVKINAILFHELLNFVVNFMCVFFCTLHMDTEKTNIKDKLV